MKTLITRAVVGIAALALFATACASEAPTDTQPPETAAAAPAEEPDSSGEVEPEASFQEEELDGALVSSFPDDVPLYPGDVVSSLAALSEVSEQPEWNVLISTGDSFDAVDAAIRSDYSSAGWSIRSEMEYMGGFMLVTGNDNYTVSITYNDLDGTGISINYGVSS